MLEVYYLCKCMMSFIIFLMNFEFYWNVIYDSFFNSWYLIWDKLVEVCIVVFFLFIILRKLMIGEVF